MDLKTEDKSQREEVMGLHFDQDEGRGKSVY